MVNNKIVNEDYNFSNEKLYFRNKINSFEVNDIEALCFYFPKGNSFFVSYLLDFFEITEISILNNIKEILTKDEITMIDISNLIIIFGNYSEHLTQEESIKIANEEFRDLEINQLYFSV